MRLLGIDYGTKKIGLSTSDREGKMAFPFSVLDNPKSIEKLSDLIVALCIKEGVGQIVIGHSLDYKNKTNPIVEETDKLIKTLGQKTEIPVFYQPEVLTTEEAKRLQGDVEKIDASAATLILQSFIDKNKMI